MTMLMTMIQIFRQYKPIGIINLLFCLMCVYLPLTCVDSLRPNRITWNITTLQTVAWLHHQQQQQQLDRIRNTSYKHRCGLFSAAAEATLAFGRLQSAWLDCEASETSDQSWGNWVGPMRNPTHMDDECIQIHFNNWTQINSEITYTQFFGFMKFFIFCFCFLGSHKQVCPDRNMYSTIHCSLLFHLLII